MSINAWSEKLPYRAFVSLSAQALCANYREIRRYAAGKKIIAVVKADAYGHGAVPVAMILEREGADRFAVATLDEAKVLREAGITRPILVLGPSDPAAVKMMAQLQVGVTVADFAYGQKLAAAATAAKVTICVHIKIDTGMTRLGFLTDGTSLPETLEQIKALFSTGSLIPEGLYSHYASSDSDRQMTAAQRSCFFVVRDALLEICDFPVIHLENSGALCHDEIATDYVRAGIVLYGEWPNFEEVPPLKLTPVMSVFGRIVQIKELRESAAVSYGGIAQVKAGAKIAVVEFGYADGIDRRLSNRGYVMICGKKAPILGRVCMDRLIADITDIDDVTTDDYALYFGRDGDTILRAGTVASLVDTISYELLCRINARLPRIWTEENHDNLLKMP